MSAQSYIVAVPSELHHDGTVYRPGDSVTLPDECAEALVADGVVAPAGALQNDPPAGARPDDPPAAPEGEERKAAIRAAIGELDPADDSKWTKDREPTVDALAGVLGFDISAAERDEAWAAIEAGGKG